MAAGIAQPDPLIAEARRRARLRRGTIAALAVAALIAAAFFALRDEGSKPGVTPIRERTKIGATTKIPPQDSVLYTARARALYAFVIPPGGRDFVRIIRATANARPATTRVPFDLPGYAADISAGPHGLYIGTSVIRRFTNAADELVRFDPRTFTELARASFPAAVSTVARGNRLWATLGDGRILRLDPRTLDVQASVKVAGSAAEPAFGLRSLWVLAGREMIRMDPKTLAVRSRTRLPPRQAFTGISADSDYVYLVGRAVAPVDAAGRIGRPIHVPDLATAALSKNGLVGLTNGTPTFVELTLDGRITARTSLKDAGATLAVSGGNAWFLGDAGAGPGLVHVRIAGRQP